MLQTALVRRFALSLGWLGVAPFAGLAFAALFETGLAPRAWAVQALAVYGGVILSFIGGITWGLTVGEHGAQGLGVQRLGPRDLLFAIALSLVAFAGALAAPALGLPLLAAGFLAALVYDLRQVAGGRFPSWYKRLRIALTSCAVAALSGASAFAL